VRLASESSEVWLGEQVAPGRNWLREPSLYFIFIQELLY
jgi:hypothetical protein